MKRIISLSLIIIFLTAYTFAETVQETENIDTKFIITHETFGVIQFYGFYDDEDICNRFGNIFYNLDPPWDFNTTKTVIQKGLKETHLEPEEIERLYLLMKFDKYKYAASLFVWNELNVLWIMKYENNIIYEICVPLI